MTMKHMIDGLMQTTKSRSFTQLGELVGLEPASVVRLARGYSKGVGIEKISSINVVTGIPLDTLFAWYRLPDDAVLGRVESAGGRP